MHRAVRRLQETVVVDTGVRRQRPEQPDVRALRGLDRADAPIVGVVDVAHVETGALPRQSARAKRGEPALVRQLRERIGLVHELRELRAAEELAHRGHHRADVDERTRRRLLLVEDRHALLHHALHAEQAHPELVLDQLAHRADAPVAQVVDVVRARIAVVDPDHHPDHLDDVLLGERAVVRVNVLVHAPVHLVPADAPQVVAARVEEQVVQQRACALDARGLAGAEPAVDLHQRLRLRLDGRVALEGRADVGVRLVVVDVREQPEQLLVAGVPEGAQERGHRQLALAVDLDRHDVARVRLELEPRAAIGDQLGERDVASRAGVHHAREVRAGGAHELADHHALGAVDDEGARRRHQRYVAEEERLLLDLLGLLDLKLHRYIERRFVGHLPDPALRLVELRLAELVGPEPQLEAVAGHVLDRVDLVEHLADILRLEGLEGVRLDLDQAGGLQHLGDAGVGSDGRGTVRGGHQQRHTGFYS